jgi:hypothetical protein
MQAVLGGCRMQINKGKAGNSCGSAVVGMLLLMLGSAGIEMLPNKSLKQRKETVVMRRQD